jgi:membrane protein
VNDGSGLGRRAAISARIAARIDGLRARAGRRYPRFSRTVIDPLAALAPRVAADRLGVEAGSMTYGAFLALPPALLLLVVGASLFLSGTDLRTGVVHVVEAAIPGLEQAVPKGFGLDPGGQLGIGLIGLVGLLWSASGFAARARIALAKIFGTRTTGLIAGRFSAGLVGVPVFVGLVAFATFDALTSRLKVTGIVGAIAHMVINVGVVAASVPLFMVVYWFLAPRGSHSLKEHLPGAIAFAVAWTILGLVGSIYVGQVIARSKALYGTLGAIFGVLAFLYVAMWLFLLGAELSQVMSERRQPIRRPS